MNTSPSRISTPEAKEISAAVTATVTKQNQMTKPTATAMHIPPIANSMG